MTITCTIETRLSSARLPGKALYPFYETTILGAAIANARAIPGVDRIIVCTTIDPRDQVIAEYAVAHGAEAFCGDEENVAGRISSALTGVDGVNIFLTGDNPLVTPDLASQALRQFMRDRPDYLCSTHMKYCSWWTVPPVLPKGLSVQIADIAFFHEAYKGNTEPGYLKHSTMIMYGRNIGHRKYHALELTLPAPTDMTRSYSIDTAAEYLDLKARWPERPTTLGAVLQLPAPIVGMP